MALTIKPEWLAKWIHGGWQFSQPLPDNKGFWYAPEPLINSFRQQVGNIITWRKANPVITTKLKLSTDWDTVTGELIQQNVSRLLKIPRGDYYLQSDEPITLQPTQKKSLWQHVKSGAAAVVETVKDAISTKELMDEWLGEEGKPVERDQSETRAGICVECQQNTRKHWTLFFTRPAAKLFARTVEMKQQMKLETSHDKELGACKACRCVLELKVHVPLKHIKAHERHGMQKLDPKCWILKEES